MIDLHVHTTASDGALSPVDVVRTAAAIGLTALAVTDHDTLEGLAPAAAEGLKQGVEVIAGLEISAKWDRGILHILGYFVDTENPDLKDALYFLKTGREERTPKILDRLSALNVHVTLDEVNKESGNGVPGRPHIAAILVRKGYVRDIQEAFDRFLRKGAPAYEDKVKLPPMEAVELIAQAGGIPVLGHPYSLREEKPGVERIVTSLVDHGLQGLEVYYPKHTAEQTAVYLKIARRLGLAVTGGSDFHGANKPNVELGIIPGYSPLPYSMVEDLRRRKTR